jgi:hypothetical protein
MLTLSVQHQLVCTHLPINGDSQDDTPRFLVEPFNHVLRAQEKQKVRPWYREFSDHTRA